MCFGIYEEFVVVEEFKWGAAVSILKIKVIYV